MPSQSDLEFTVKMQDQTSAALKSMDASFAALTKTLTAQTVVMQQLIGAMSGGIAAHRQSADAAIAHKAGLDAVSAALKEVKEKHEEAAEGAEKEEVSLKKLVGTAKEAAEAFSAIWGSSEIIEMTIGKWSEAEVAITRLRQTMGSTKDEAHEMYEAMDDIAGISLGSTTEQLVKIAQSASELGLSAEKVKEFAKNTAMLATVTGVSADQISGSMIQVLTSTNEVETGIHAFSEAFAEMQRRTAGGTQTLMEMSLSLSRMTAGTQVTSLEILGVASAMSHLGVNTRFAGSAIEQSLQTFQQLANDTKLAPQLGLMASAMHLMPEEFKEIEKTDPTQIFIKFLGAINDIIAKHGDVHKFLSDFGMGGQQTQTVLEAAAKRVDTFTESIKEAQKAGQGSNLEKMFGELGATIVGQIDTIEKSFGTMTEKLGSELGPAVHVILMMVQGVIDTITNLSNAVGPIGTTIAAALIVGLPAIVAFQTAFKFLWEVFETGGGTVKRFGGILSDLVRAMIFLRTAEGDVARGAKEAESGLEGVAEKEVEVAEGAASAEKGLTRVAEKEGMVAEGSIAAKAGLAAVATELGIVETVASKSIFSVSSLFKWLLLFQGADFVGNALGKVANAYLPDDIKKTLVNWRDNSTIGKGLVSAENLFGNYTPAQKEEQEQAASKEGEGEKSKENETRAPADKGERQSRANDDAITAQYKGDLQAIMDLEKKRATINSQLLSVEKLLDAPDALLQKFDLTRDMVQSQSDLLKLQQAQLDPLYQQGIAWEQAMQSAGAYTKAEQDAADTANKVYEAVQKAKEALTDQGKAALETAMQQKMIQDSTRDTSSRHELETMLRTLSTSYALNQADKDRLEVDNQIVQLWETHDYTKDQLDHMRQLLTLTKQVQEQSAQFSELNPQAKAIQDYEDKLKTLKERFPQGGDEFNREKTRLEQSTLAARSPIGNLAQQQADEIKQLEISGKYREADLKTLQEITDLEHQGVLNEGEKSKEIEAQIKDNNRRVQDIKDMQSELDSLTQSFGSGLSGAIQGALAGQKYAFQKFLASLGGKMMDMAFSQFAKELEPGVNGVLGSFFGVAKTGNDALTKLAEEQVKRTKDVAAPTVAEMLIKAQNVVIQANTIAGLKNGDSQNAGVNTSSPAISAPASPSVPAPASESPEVKPAPKGTVSMSGASTLTPGSIVSTGDDAHPINWDAIPKTVKTAHAAVSNVIPFPKERSIAAPVGEVTKSDLPAPSTGSNTYGGLGTNPFLNDSQNAGKAAFDKFMKTPNVTIDDARKATKMSGLDIPDISSESTYARKNEHLENVQGFIFHHTGSRSNAAGQYPDAHGIVDQLNHRTTEGAAPGGLGVQYVMDRDGKIFQTLPTDSRGAHIMPSRVNGLSNSNTEGMEVIAADDKDVTEAQKRAAIPFARQFSATHPGVQYFGHGELSNQNRQPTEGKSIADLVRADQAATQHAPVISADDPLAKLPLAQRTLANYRSGDFDSKPTNASAYTDQGDLASALLARGRKSQEEYEKSKPANDNHGPDFKAMQTSINSAANSVSSLGKSSGDSKAKIDLATTSIADLGKASTDTSKKVDDGSKTAPPSSGGAAPTVPTTDANGDAGSNSGSQLANGVEGLGQQALGHIPGAAPIMQGFNLLKSLFGSLFGGSGGAAGGATGAGGGGGLLGGLFSGLFGLLHSGGLVGPGMTTTFRSVNPAIFATARRFHDGLGDDEFPAILQKGERVLTASQDARNTNAMNRLANAVANQSTPAGTVAPVVPGTTNHFSMVVNTPDAPSFRRSSSQIMAIQAAAGARANSKHN